MPTVAAGTPDPDGNDRKSEVFFRRAAKVAAVGNVEYAIEMYVQGLTIAPHRVDGHQALRRLGIERRFSGGRPLDHFQRTRLSYPGRTPLDDLLAGAKLLAYDPANLDYARRMLTAATSLGFTDVADWLARLLRPSSGAPVHGDP